MPKEKPIEPDYSPTIEHAAEVFYATDFESLVQAIEYRVTVEGEWSFWFEAEIGMLVMDDADYDNAITSAGNATAKLMQIHGDIDGGFNVPETWDDGIKFRARWTARWHRFERGSGNRVYAVWDVETEHVDPVREFDEKEAIGVG